MAGVSAAIRFLADQGEGDSLRGRLTTAMQRIHEHEIELAKTLYKGLESLDGVEVAGPTITDPRRAPTLAVTVEGMRPEAVCHALAECNILAWDGHFYGIRPMEALGLLDQGGVTRLGISLYNTEDEVQRTIDAVKELAGC